MAGKKPLTPKQARFVSEYAKDQNATQAAIRAGYAKASAEVQGCRLLRNDQIRAALAKAQARIAKRNEITTDSLLTELEQARRVALRGGQASAMVAATLGKGKLTGKLIERRHHSGTIGSYDLSRISDEDLNRLESILGPLALDGGDPGGEGEAAG